MDLSSIIEEVGHYKLSRNIIMQSSISRVIKVFVSGFVASLLVAVPAVKFTGDWKNIVWALVTAALYGGYRAIENAYFPKTA